MADFLENHQVALYLLALVAGGAASFMQSAAVLAEPLVSPALAALLLATFLCIPLRQAATEKPPRGFVSGLLVLNFLLVPAVLALLLAVTPAPDALLFTAALVLLAPCIDYVVVFCGLAGGSSRRLLAATPLLLGAQLLAVPLWLFLLGHVGLWSATPVTSAALRAGATPAVLALAVVLVPLLLAWVLQGFRTTSHRAQEYAEAGMVPLMLAVLFLTAAAHTHSLAGEWASLAPLVPVYAVFALLTGVLAWWGSRHLLRPAAHPDRLALTFSAVTRNALIVLPLVLGLSALAQSAGTPGATLMPIAVVTQTLVELLVMTGMVALFRARKNRAPAPK